MLVILFTVYYCTVQHCKTMTEKVRLVAQVNESVLESPDRHSLLPLPGITAVPGDRFRELYYWDSFWVIKGLLVSRMTKTATSEVRNLLSLQDTYGHVPNGARCYYINRRWSSYIFLPFPSYPFFFICLLLLLS